MANPKATKAADTLPPALAAEAAAQADSEAVTTPDGPAPDAPGTTTLTVGGVPLWDRDTNDSIQIVLGLPVTGMIDPPTIRGVQRAANVRADGGWSDATARGLQRLLGVDESGEFDPTTRDALTERLTYGSLAVPPEPVEG